MAGLFGGSNKFKPFITSTFLARAENSNQKLSTFSSRDSSQRICTIETFLDSRGFHFA